MIIPLAVVIALQGQGKPTPLQRRWIEAESHYDQILMGCHLSFTVPSKEEEENKRIEDGLSKEFESIAKASAKTSLSLDAWMLALLSSPKDLKRENYLLDHILAVKSVDADQKEFFKRWHKCFLYFAHTFGARNRVTNIVDLFTPVPKTKEEKARLLMNKASWLDDTNDFKWEIYDRLVTDFKETPAGIEARSVILKKKHLERGNEFFDFVSKDSDGKKFQLSSFRGKVVVLEFWANWCPSCQRTIPVMQGVEKEFAGQPVEFIGINSDGDAPVVKEIQAKWGMTTRTLVDGSPTGPISTRYAIMAWPSFFVIGKDGKVVFRSSGIDAEGMTRAIREASK